VGIEPRSWYLLPITILTELSRVPQELGNILQHCTSRTKRCQASVLCLMQIFVDLMFVDPCTIVKFIQKNPTRRNSVPKFIIPYLYKAQHVSGDTPPIIRNLKLHWQLLVLHTWKVVGRVVAGRCQAAAWQSPATTRPTTFHLCKTRGC